MKIKTPKDIQEFKEQLNKLIPDRNNFRISNEKKENVFNKVKSYLKDKFK
ncbi:hypothetical protein [Oceanobacillus kimchii]|uniref:Uncharacterized protein n=1 Tax=Oceanobacillus kimchii TaxID=746691 RepID=A0ABQ5TNX0_9BACI|nr:hypothetical protein [Oceanobacillus kimchii]GLO66267.1 hypothetical protein MACH08_20510 [Oceanobacillus kimchii]